MASNQPDRGLRGLPGGKPKYSAFAIAKQQLGLAPVKLEEALEMEALAQAGCFGADEFLEGSTAFLEKRSPVFRK